MSEPAWLRRLRARGSHLDPEWVEVLRAFDSPAPARDPLPQAPHLARRIARQVGEEVDADQARMFARRFLAAVVSLDQGAQGDSLEAALLREGLLRRMEGILDSPGPRVLRVRACADFYAGHSARLAHLRRHAGQPLPDLAQLARQVRWEQVAPGVEHGRLAGDAREGPVRVNLLRLQGVRLEVRHLYEHTRQGRDLASLSQELGAVAALSGGFFLYSEVDIRLPDHQHDPVGLWVEEGVVRGPPLLRRGALVQDQGGAITLERVGPEGLEFSWLSGTWHSIRSHHGEGPRPTTYTRAWGLRSPPAPWSLAVTASQVVAHGPGALDIPLAGAVIAMDHPPRVLPEVGAPIRWRLPPAPSGLPVRAALAGGPLLLRQGQPGSGLEAEDFQGTAPPVTFSRDETYGQNLLPRMALGLDPQHRLLAAAVDGRDLQRAPGLTLAQTASLLAALECHTVLNLDGGSSKRMVVGGRQVDQASTELHAGQRPEAAPRRPVHTAILVYSP